MVCNYLYKLINNLYLILLLDIVPTQPVVTQPPTPIVTQLARQSVIQFTPRITLPTPQEHIQIASKIFVPDIPDGGYNVLSEDEICTFHIRVNIGYSLKHFSLKKYKLRTYAPWRRYIPKCLRYNGDDHDIY